VIFDDDQLSVRHGTTQGKSTENRMLQAMGGQDTIKKRFQTNVDGSVVMAHTRGPGTQPEFITSLLASIPIEVTAYMESGQLEWSYPAPLSPSRLDTAVWHFLDITTTEDFLGEISLETPTLGQQVNSTSLVEGGGSLAISGTESSVIKKLVAGLYPASLYSGKMRNFIQAQYGAIDSPGRFRLSGDGESLKYLNGSEIQFGLWANNSPGIYTAIDGTWWLLTITGGPTFSVTAYPINQDAIGAELVAQYKLNVLTDDYKERLETYIFAYSTIELSAPYVVGTFTGAAGSAMSYGWKWKKDGSRASIVVHELLGTGAADYRWKSSTMHLDISYSPLDPVSAASFSISETITVNGEWTDGWGTYNLFVPTSANVRGQLILYSLATNMAGVKPAFNFSGIPIYGYYKSDVWTPVTLSRNISTGASNTQINGDLFDVPAQELLANNYQYSYNFSNIAIHYRSEQIYAGGSSMTISIDGSPIVGSTSNGSFTFLDTSYSGGNVSDNPVSIAASQVRDETSVFHGYPPGFLTYNANGEGSAHGGFIEWGPATRSYQTFEGSRIKAWAMVIPSCDCDSVYVATKESYGAGTGVKSIRTGRSIVRFFSSVSSFVPYIDSGHFGGWYAFGVDMVESIDNNPPSPATVVGVTCYNKTISGVAGTPSASYSALFDVDKNYPYFDAGMYAYSGVGDRYVMSEGPKSPASVDADHRFVGWA